MPKVTGREMLERIKSDEALKAIPVVMLTSSHGEAAVDASYRLGVNACVVKPVDFDLLLDWMSCLGRFWTVINRTIQRRPA